MSFADASLLAFPVRCTKSAFAWVTSPCALARAQRLLAYTGRDPSWEPVTVDSGQALVVADGLTDEDSLFLEVFQYTARRDEQVERIAAWLAEHALPEELSYSYFRQKMRTDLVVLPDEDFDHYVRHATLVEPHVRINDETGAADDGGLFYAENLPPESLLLGSAMASRVRKKGDGRSADDVLATILDASGEGIDQEAIQIGGDASTGRGLVVIKALRTAGGQP